MSFPRKFSQEEKTPKNVENPNIHVNWYGKAMPAVSFDTTECCSGT